MHSVYNRGCAGPFGLGLSELDYPRVYMNECVMYSNIQYHIHDIHSTRHTCNVHTCMFKHRYHWIQMNASVNLESSITSQHQHQHQGISITSQASRIKAKSDQQSIN